MSNDRRYACVEDVATVL